MHNTVAAISTPPGTGGIAVIRISGETAVSIADAVFEGGVKLCDAPSHTVHYGFIKNSKGEKIDEVLVTVMRAPKTFTREDVVEISTHGGMTAPREVLAALVTAGADLAEPGEFTKRAFLNGRIDLSQAEAVIDIINSKNALAKNNALSQLEGTLSEKIRNVRSRLVHLASQMQVIIDYPDEELEDVTTEDIRNVCEACLCETQSLLKTSDSGKLMRDGIRAAIVGKPNVGKSSLLNALAGTDRAIVTDIAGTTRDVIEEYVNLDGIMLILSDTAGIRETDDTVERIGVEKSEKSIAAADVVLAVFDGSRQLTEEDRRILQATADKKRIVIINKCDMEHSACSEEIKKSDKNAIEISAKNGDGTDKLSDVLKKMYNLGDISASSDTVITNIRHKKALEEAGKALKRAAEAIDAGMPADIASIDINAAIEALGEITGETVSDLIVESIFHNFCVGK